jgi:hypothetical protein
MLNGIVRCGRCGKPMGARNARADANPRYACDSEYQEYGGPRCQSAVAAYPDRLVESLVLKAMEPASLELSLRAAERAERDREQLHTHWKQRLERAGYEADRAKRQYDAVDPENRLVARELERQWEQNLGEKQKLEEDHARFRAEQPRHLSASDREQIGALAANLPGLWRSTTTTGGDRRAIMRLLVERAELTRHGQGQRVEVVIHWRGGSVTRHEIPRACGRTPRWRGWRSSGRGCWSCVATVGRPMRLRQCSTAKGIRWLAGTRSPERGCTSCWRSSARPACRRACATRATCRVPTSVGYRSWRSVWA